MAVGILVVEEGHHILSSLNEALDVDAVRDVGVEVVLEVLDGVHVLHHIVKSAHTGEAPGGIEQFPGVDSGEGHLKLVSNLDSVFVILDIEMSRELVHLPVELVFGDPESLLAVASSGSLGIENAIILLAGHEVVIIIGFRALRLGRLVKAHSLLNSRLSHEEDGVVFGEGIGGRNESEQQQEGGGVFHFIII